MKKYIPLPIRQLLVILLLIICLTIGSILLFGEYDQVVSVLVIILTKIVGLAFLALSIAILRGLIPNILED